MRWSQTFIPTLKESPAEAEMEITYVGGLDALRTALRGAGIALTDGAPTENGDPGPATVRLLGGAVGRSAGDVGPGTAPAAPPPDKVESLPRPETQ